LIFITEGASDPVNYKRQLDLPDVTYSDSDFGFAPPLPAASANGEPAAKKPRC